LVWTKAAGRTPGNSVNLKGEVEDKVRVTSCTFGLTNKKERFVAVLLQSEFVNWER